MVGYAIGKIQYIERSTKDITIEEVMIDGSIHSHKWCHGTSQQPTKWQTRWWKRLQEKEWQISTFESSAQEWQRRLNHLSDMSAWAFCYKLSAVRQGELFPGKSDKDSKRKGEKGSQEFNVVEEATEKVCLLCSQLKNIPEGAAKIIQRKNADSSPSLTSCAEKG